LTGMEFAAADGMNPEEIIKATKGCDFIFNGLNPVYTDWDKKCVVFAQNVLAAAKANGAIHLFPGNVYNFGSGMPEVLTPATAQKPDHHKAMRRVEMEQLFAGAAITDGIQTIILRAGDFFGGDGKGSWFDEAVISKLAKGKVIYPGNRNIVHAWAYLPDLAKDFVALAEKAETIESFKIFHFEGHNVSGEQMHQAIEAAMGKTLKRSKLPKFIISFLRFFNPKMSEINEVFYIWTTPHQVKDAELEKLVGELKRTPLVDAVQNAIADQGLSAHSKTRVEELGNTAAAL
ncbi:MAG: oxidoreductase, partial [Salaquimonas sp.]